MIVEGLLSAYGVDAGAAPALRSLLETIATDPAAPTTVVDPAEGLRAHIEDSLDGLRAPAVRRATRLADLGAGAGLPGLVLAAALPACRVTLVESVGKKCEFMRRAATAAGLDVQVVHARAEDWPEGLGGFDVVTARALAPLTALVEYAAPLLIDGGHLVAYKGRRDASEEADGLAAAALTGMCFVEIVEIPPRPGADERRLHVFKKTRPTPARFPRRPGMARKKPIRA